MTRGTNNWLAKRAPHYSCQLRFEICTCICVFVLIDQLTIPVYYVCLITHQGINASICGGRVEQMKVWQKGEGVRTKELIYASVGGCERERGSGTKELTHVCSVNWRVSHSQVCSIENRDIYITKVCSRSLCIRK